MTITEHDDIRLLRSPKEVWADAKEILAKKLPAPTYHSWIKSSILLEFNDDEAVVGVFNKFAFDLFEGKLRDTVLKALSDVLKRDISSLRVILDAKLKADADYEASIGSIAIVSATPEGPQPSRYQGGLSPQITGQNNIANLNAKYTFETFVIGSHNHFVHSAALAVAANPGQSYSPLFLYGGVGLGKTHLMQAIGHEILKHSPNLSVRYISCERFTNELINSIRDNRMLEFRKRYRQVDVLLVDDIQFIQGKDSTQEEFFHTFNTLREHAGQIVLSSDRPPKALAHLEERLRSRFEWGLIADIQAPDLETRVAILRKKRELDKMHVSDDTLEYIASVFTTNIRELEGALIRTHAYASMTGTELTHSVLKGLLQPVGPEKQRKALTIDQIIDTVAARYRVESSELRSAKRSQDLALPRHVAMYLAHEIMQMSFPRIGTAFGNRKHTSALYAFTRVKDQMVKDTDLAQAVKQITRQLVD